MAYTITKIQLTDGKDAIQVSNIPNGPILLRVRKIILAELENGDRVELIIKAVAYRVDPDGIETNDKRGPVKGITYHEGEELPNPNELRQKLMTVAVQAYMSRYLAAQMIAVLPTELV